MNDSHSGNTALDVEFRSVRGQAVRGRYCPASLGGEHLPSAVCRVAEPGSLVRLGTLNIFNFR